MAELRDWDNLRPTEKFGVMLHGLNEFWSDLVGEFTARELCVAAVHENGEGMVGIEFRYPGDVRKFVTDLVPCTYDDPQLLERMLGRASEADPLGGWRYTIRPVHVDGFAYEHRDTREITELAPSEPIRLQVTIWMPRSDAEFILERWKDHTNALVAFKGQWQLERKLLAEQFDPSDVELRICAIGGPGRTA